MAEPIDADADAEAIEMARQSNLGSIKCEVWKGSHLVATLNAPDLANNQEL